MQRSDLNLLLEAYSNIINIPVTPEGFKNRVHDSMIVVGKFTGKDQHLTEKGYWYRTLGYGEIEDIRKTRGVFPREGKQKGGNKNVEYGHDRSWLVG